jgi:hypothetical protein
MMLRTEKFRVYRCGCGTFGWPVDKAPPTAPCPDCSQRFVDTQQTRDVHVNDATTVTCLLSRPGSHCREEQSPDSVAGRTTEF